MKSRVVIGLSLVLGACIPAAFPMTATASAGGLTIVPAGQLAPSPGGAAKAPYGYMKLHALEFARAKAAADAKSAGGSSTTRSGGAPIVSSYSSVSPSFGGSYQTGLTPPDTTGAIGPDRYIETINTRYAIYDRSGSLLNSGSLSALTGVSGGLFGYSLSDPQMMWDAKTQRFYYSAVYYDAFLLDNGLAVGWSKTATPSSSADFCQYAIGFGSELPDYPKLGDSQDFLLYGYNLFGNAGNSYDGSEFVTVNKPPAGSSCAPTSAFAVSGSGTLHNADGTLAATPVPTNLVDDSNGYGYVVANADLTQVPSASFVSVYSVGTSGTDANGIPVPAISGPTNVPVPDYKMPANATQKNSSYRLDTLDGRFEAAVAAVDRAAGDRIGVWTAHAVFGGAGAEERWYEIDPNAGSLIQSGTVSDPSLFIWNGAVSPDRANDGSAGSFGNSMAMSVSTSSPTTYPAIQLVWKSGAAAQSPLTSLVQATAPNVDFSCSSTSPCRWGDYSGASPDPVPAGAGGRVWLANQYNVASTKSSSTAWRTWVFAVTPGG